MVGKKRLRTRAATGDVNEEAVANEQVRDDEMRVLIGIKTEFERGEGDDLYIRVFRLREVPGRQPREEWIYDPEPGDARDIRPYLAREWGPGRYRVRVTKDRTHFAQYDIDIAADLRPSKGIITPAAQPVPATSPATGMTPFEMAFLAQMERQNKRDEQFAAILERLTMQPQQQGDETDRMLKMAQLMKEFREINAPANIGLDMFKEGLGLAKTLAEGAGGDGGNRGIYDLAMAAIEKLPTFMEQIQQRQQQQHPPQQFRAAPVPPALPARPASPAAPARVAVPAAPALPGAAQNPLLALKDYLLQRAKEGAQPDLYADEVMAALGDQGLSVLENQADPLAFLEEQFPDIVPFHPWFDRLMDAIWPPVDEGNANGVSVPAADRGDAPLDTGRPGGDQADA